MSTTEFSADVKEPKISAVRLEFLNDPNLPHGGPGRSIYGTFALTEFVVEAAPLDRPAERKAITIAAASADVNPPEAVLDANFDDRSGRRCVTGPIDLAHDGKDETAWSIDVGGGRSNVPRKAVFTFDKPLEVGRRHAAPL